MFKAQSIFYVTITLQPLNHAGLKMQTLKQPKVLWN